MRGLTVDVCPQCPSRNREASRRETRPIVYKSEQICKRAGTCALGGVRNRDGSQFNSLSVSVSVLQASGGPKADMRRPRFAEPLRAVTFVRRTVA
jgi:hypothetical protein